ncbi:uncharacterized protein PWA37_000709 [Arxiozyma heterogenica]|uniref:uncharacterized protein n=1 Tax=Arxiozyma heterogenica TaxID=278026 RepID=UPI002F1C8EC0
MVVRKRTLRWKGKHTIERSPLLLLNILLSLSSLPPPLFFHLLSTFTNGNRNLSRRDLQKSQNQFDCFFFFFFFFFAIRTLEMRQALNKTIQTLYKSNEKHGRKRKKEKKKRADPKTNVNIRWETTSQNEIKNIKGKRKKESNPHSFLISYFLFIFFFCFS